MDGAVALLAIPDFVGDNQGKPIRFASSLAAAQSVDDQGWAAQVAEDLGASLYEAIVLR